VGAVRGAEGVVDVDLGQRGQRLGEGRIVGFLFGVVAQVLKQQNLAGLKLAGHLAGHFAHAVGGKGHVDAFAERLVEQFAQAVDDRAQRILWIRFALGAAQVRGQDDLGLVLEGVDDGGQRGHDAGVVGDGRAVFSERHVEVDADEDPLVGQIDVANGELWHGDHSGREVAVLAREVRRFQTLAGGEREKNGARRP
jgi:hypothetical protein